MKLQDSLAKLNEYCNNDDQLKSYITNDAIGSPTTFGIKSIGSDNAILAAVSNGHLRVFSGRYKDAAFLLCTVPNQWENFFERTPASPYQSYWGIRHKSQQMIVLGEQIDFVNFAYVWRQIIREFEAGKTQVVDNPSDEEDWIVGRYVYITSPVWGRCKVFYEQSGDGDQDIVFLHTAGSDGRQYHSVLNDKGMRDIYRMTTFDLPAHGRSFPYENYKPGSCTNSEDAYVRCIAALIKKLKLRNPIVCGASMAGHVSLAVAIRYEEVGASGVIPLEASDHIASNPSIFLGYLLKAIDYIQAIRDLQV
ncbi:Hypothetical protein R9X50_00214700 [Acrodontium crateriforme]|uniref:AB hydrolase-1 domain-containing protein n=1 Tax=Acrodontium crateriforme TaxID=150365 RepID=A0AAQ3M0Q1_9PEZI|nr:Hypothetical protein R9X50_00214700 [Acrodontium crateriforme]